MSIADNIKRLRASENLSQVEFGRIAGVTDKAVSTWEAGIKTPRMGAIERIAAHFGLPKSAILDDDDESRIIPPGFEPIPKMVLRPIVGDIACGDPITAEQNIQDYAEVPEQFHCDFCLRCHGDSMVDAGIQDGDIVYIHIQPEVHDGEIAAVRIGEEATLKRVYYDGTTITLVPANSAYRPKSYSGPALNDIQIEGKAVGFTHWF